MEVGLLGDAKAVVNDLLAEVKATGVSGDRRQKREKMLAEMFARVSLPVVEEDVTPFEPIAAAQAIENIIPRDAIFTASRSLNSLRRLRKFARKLPDVYGGSTREFKKDRW